MKDILGGCTDAHLHLSLHARSSPRLPRYRGSARKLFRADEGVIVGRRTISRVERFGKLAGFRIGSRVKIPHHIAHYCSHPGNPGSLPCSFQGCSAYASWAISCFPFVANTIRLASAPRPLLRCCLYPHLSLYYCCCLLGYDWGWEAQGRDGLGFQDAVVLYLWKVSTCSLPRSVIGVELQFKVRVSNVRPLTSNLLRKRTIWVASKGECRVQCCCSCRN